MIAGELIGRLMFDHAPLSAIALTADSTVLTATANDYGFEHVFSRQVLGLGRPGDVLLPISTWGNSPNVLAAIAALQAKGLLPAELDTERVTVEPPRDPSHGDAASNAALVLAKPAGRPRRW